MKKRSIVIFIFGLLLLVAAAGAAWRWLGPGEWPWGQGSASERRAAPATRAEVPTGMKRYSHAAFRFSLIIPEDMKVGGYREAGQTARTITFTMPEADGRQFQIYVVPYEKDSITSSQVSKDTHGRAMGDVKDIAVNDAIRAITFTTDDPALGSLREIWFLRDGRLFEATAPIADGDWLAGILATLSFSDKP